MGPPARAKEESPVTRSAADQVQVRQDSHDDDRVRFEREAIPYMRQMFPAAHRLTHDRCDAEDLIQETFARAYQKFHQFSPGTNLRAWLHRIMFHTFYSNYRKRCRRPAETLTGDFCDAIGTSPASVPASRSAETEALSNLASSPAMQALGALPDNFKTVIYLADIQGYQYNEIADIMGTPIGTVMSRIHRGRGMLRARLQGQGSQPRHSARQRPGRAVPQARPEVVHAQPQLQALPQAPVAAVPDHEAPLAA
jgi:RNA polymerase sigma-70 factor (ECF subfamily)